MGIHSSSGGTKSPAVSYLPRALAVWLLIMAIEVLSGVLRNIFLVPAIGDIPARQLGVLTGSIIILAVSYFALGRFPVKSNTALLSVGLIWMVLTIMFELFLGKVVLGVSWSTMVSDYRLDHGRLMPIGLIVMALSPLIANQLRRWRSRRTNGKPHLVQ